MKRIIIAGSREYAGWRLVDSAIRRSGIEINPEEDIIVSGAARGIDTVGEVWAEDMGMPVVRFPAQWEALGRSAGSKRNKEMADYADALIAIWDGYSVGTKHMIQTAQDQGLEVFVWFVGELAHLNYKKSG